MSKKMFPWLGDPKKAREICENRAEEQYISVVEERLGERGDTPDVRPAARACDRLG
jgi:hypothetical protein